MRSSGRGLVWIVLVLAMLTAGAVLVRTMRHRDVAVDIAPPTNAPATRPTSAPSKSAPPKPAAPPPPTYLDAIRANLPNLPTTRPLAVPLNLSQAAHLRIKDPIYIDLRYNLWITRPDARPTAAALAKPDPDGENIVRERVLFVHWAPTSEQDLAPRLIVPAKAGGFEIVSTTSRKPIGSGRDYDWGRSRTWEDRIVVPSATGVSVFHFDRDPGGQGAIAVEDYQDLLHPTSPATMPASQASTIQPATRPDVFSAGLAEPQMLFDGQGFLAWLPWEKDKTGGIGAARYVDGKWSLLGKEQGWPEQILHLVPLLGGSVMQLYVAENKGVRLGVSELAGGEIDRKAVEQLVGDLDAPEPKAREEAFTKLTRFGPAIRPMLREMVKDLSPEAQARAKQLLRDQVQPLLGPMTLLGDKIQLVSRHADGGAVFYAESGVEITQPDGDPLEQVPAWLAVRPGRAAQVLPGTLVEDLRPQTAQIMAVAGHDDDWVVVSDIRGPRRFYGNGLTALLRKDEDQFTELVGVDRGGRWLFRKPGKIDPHGPVPETLILDPTLPDLVPRLPVWNFTTADEVGWDRDNWPAVKQGETVLKLTELEWAGLEQGDPLLTRRDQIPVAPPPTKPATTKPSSQSSSRPTEPSTQPAIDYGTPLLVTDDGTRYFGGEDSLRVVSPAGTSSLWTLPAIANGKQPVRLVRAQDGSLFLFNQPGRVLRLKPTPGQGEPFKLDATFTRNIPSVDDPTRIWLDPAGRIIIAYESRLAILFPAGFIPPSIREKILNADEAEGIDP